MKQLTIGSLFSGIGGGELGLEQTGYFRTIWQVEIKPYCRRILAQQWPNAEQFDNVRTVGKHNLKPVDILIGGFPCQDISTAGTMEGIHGKRSGLWAEYRRILRELQPTYILVENVSALRYVTKSQGTLQPAPIATILGDLAESRYDAEWISLHARQFGLPHNRERVFILAYPNGSRVAQILYNPPVCRTPQQSPVRHGKLDSRRITLHEFEQRVGQRAILGEHDG